MRKLFITFLIVSVAMAVQSCMDDENEIILTDYISLESSTLPDTVEVNEPFQISFTASAPSSCWHSIVFLSGVKEDTICGYAAMATYENHGESCLDVEVTKDTTVTFTPTLAKSYVFQIVKSYSEVSIDTVVVVESEIE